MDGLTNYKMIHSDVFAQIETNLRLFNTYSFNTVQRFLTSRLIITKLCASSEISLDSANLGFSADVLKKRENNKQD